MNPIRKRAYLELLLVAIIWGFAGPIIKYTLDGFSTPVFLTYRFLISSLIAVPFFIFGISKIPKDPKIFWFTVLSCFLGTTVSLLLLFWGTEKTSSIDMNLISAIAPITIAVAGVFFLNEHVTKRESFGILIALTGTLIAIIEPTFKTNDGYSALIGNTLVFASVLVGTANIIMSKIILRKEVDPFTITNISFIVGFVTIAPLALKSILDSNFRVITDVPISYHLGVFYMALISGTLAYSLWYKSLKSIETSEAGLFSYMYPIFGIPLSILWLKESITPTFIAGSAIVVLGVILAEWKKAKN